MAEPFHAETRCATHDEYLPCHACEVDRDVRSNLSKTFGKGGRREIPAVADEQPSVARAMLEALDRAKATIAMQDALAGAPGKCARHGCTRDRALGSVWCTGHAAAASAAGDGGASLTCDNLPVVGQSGVGGGGEFDNLPAYIERSCAAEEAEQSGGDPSRLEAECNCCHANQPCECCPVHWPKAASAGKQIPRELLADAFEAQWQQIAEDSRMDPVTVAACKNLRDIERGMLG